MPAAGNGHYGIEAAGRGYFAKPADVLKGGLRIYTTIDMTLQRHAEEAIAPRLSLRALEVCRVEVSEDGTPECLRRILLDGNGAYERCLGSHTDPPDEPMTAPSAVF